MARKGPDRRSLLQTAGVAAAGALAAPDKTFAQAAPKTARAYRAEWYDLPDDKRASFLSWLHGSYLPRLKGTAGVVWVGHYKIADKTDVPPEAGGSRRVTTDDPRIPKGSQYVLLTAGESTETFMGWRAPVPQLESSAEKELAVRLAWREAVYIEEISVVGPAAGAGGIAAHEPPPSMQLGNYNVRTPDDERELSRSYRLQKFLEVQRTPGQIGARKLVSLVGWTKHGILYEFDGVKPDDSGLFESRMSADRKPPPVKIRPSYEYVVHAPGAPHAGVRIWPEA